MDVEFVTSCSDLNQRPQPVLPEFAFFGRSNCGKSSLINYFLQRKNIARTSSKPGKTRLLNYFLVGDRFYLVDLPGYGYAKVSKQQRGTWLDLFRGYLLGQDRPQAIFHLLDIRHQPSADDLQMSRWVRQSGHPFALAVTKIDKVGTNSRAARYRQIIEALDVPGDTPFFPTSASRRNGREAMWEWVEALLAAATDD